MVKVSVPATSANIGSGFDSCGLALSLYNTAAFEEFDGVDITSSDGTFVPSTPGQPDLPHGQGGIRAVRQAVPRPAHRQTNPIPMARGLGSSSACIAAGILGANALLGGPLEEKDILTFATKLEGHPDNVAPALLGGFVVSAYDEGHVYSLKKTIAPGITFAAFIPDFKLLTEKARAALPKMVSHADAVYNLSRAALLATAFCEERYDFLPVAAKDSLHQQYRLPLIEGGEAVFALADGLGALATFISGAGPTILSVVRTAEANVFFERAQAALESDEELAHFTLHRFVADNEGAKVV